MYIKTTNMYKRSVLIISFLLFIIAGIMSCSQSEKKSSSSSGPVVKALNVNVKPFRVLVIIGDQWTDPMSYGIDPTRVKDEDFLDVVTMLKIWGVPFDILRLDEQRLQINRFLDGVAKPNYGCVIWMADPDKLQGYSANYETLSRAVNEYGISLIALTDYIKTDAIANLVGVKYENVKQVQLGGKSEKFAVKGNHFITSGAEGLNLPDVRQLAGSTIPEANGITVENTKPQEDVATINMVNCTVSGSATVLGKIGETPQLVVRDIDNDTKTVWIGGGHDWFRKYPVMRKIFREALVYSIGYGVFNDNFDNGFICIMDDVGCAEHSYSLTWHYPTPAKDTLLKYLIEPLEKYGFMMVQNITPGFANPKTKMIESSWSIPPFTDIFGNLQDYGSTKEGLDEGLRRGVFEIQPHRAWSHMNWDLESPPGPFWGPADGEMRKTDWYNEVVDVRRDNAAVPSNDLLFIYKMGIDAVKKSFGVVPLAAEVRPGAELKAGKPGGFDNGRIAAIAGLGVSRECYVGFDHTIEFRMMMPEQFTFHDLDLTAQTKYPADQPEAGWDNLLKMTTEELMASKIAGGRRLNVHDSQNWIESRKNKYWMGFNETCAYLHSGISNNGKDGFAIEFSYDDHYCNYFGKKPSFWTLELSDSFRQDSGTTASIFVDGKTVKADLGSKQKIEIPAGLGIHKLEIGLN
jgi:hypothetical protein